MNTGAASALLRPLPRATSSRTPRPRVLGAVRALWWRARSLRVAATASGALCAAVAVVLPLLAMQSAHADNAPAPPDELRVTDSAVTHRLRLTGADERVFLIFPVYRIAHYAATDGDARLTRSTVIEDGPAKGLQITFARRLRMEQIRKEFARTLRRNAEPAWLSEAQQTIEAFIEAIDRDVDAGDRLSLYWLPGGRLLADFNGERAFAATDIPFNKALWSIWFGADPVCDREELLARLPGDGAG